MINQEIIEAQLPEFEIAYLRKSDLELLRLHNQNKQDLQTLKHIMETEEDRVYDTEMVLKRVIDHYAKFVPFERSVIDGTKLTNLM